MPDEILRKKKKKQCKIYRQAAAKSRRLYFPVTRRLHPSKIYPTRRLRIVRVAGEAGEEGQSRGLRDFSPFFGYFRAGSPNTDRRLFESALVIPPRVHLLDALLSLFSAPCLDSTAV